MPQYMLLIYGPPDDNPPPEEMGAVMERWFAYTQAMIDAGAMVSGEALNMPDTATTVRVRDGETLVTDGPFAETAEMLGGFYVIDVPDLETAQHWAARMPNADVGSIEVREIAVMPDPPSRTGAAEGSTA
jgi:hypothetical protein